MTTAFSRLASATDEALNALQTCQDPQEPLYWTMSIDLVDELVKALNSLSYALARRAYIRTQCG